MRSLVKRYFGVTKASVCVWYGFSLILALETLQPLYADNVSQLAGRRSTKPQYNRQGELNFPKGFENWVFVGANLGLQYQDDKGPPLRLFHNVYITPRAFRHYRRTGTFPEKTMLLIDFYSAETGDPQSVVADGLFPGREQSFFFVSVKNRLRPDGSLTPWAYYVFTSDKPTAAAMDDQSCYQCHLEHGADDNVFLQFYPILQKYHE